MPRLLAFSVFSIKSHSNLSGSFGVPLDIVITSFWYSSISLDILCAIAALFPEPFLALPYVVSHQASFLTFAHYLWIEVSLHIAKRTALQPAISAAKIQTASSP